MNGDLETLFTRKSAEDSFVKIYNTDEDVRVTLVAPHMEAGLWISEEQARDLIRILETVVNSDRPHVAPPTPIRITEASEAPVGPPDSVEASAVPQDKDIPF